MTGERTCVSCQNNWYKDISKGGVDQMKKKRLFRLAAVLAAGTMLFSNSFMAFAAEGKNIILQMLH